MKEKKPSMEKEKSEKEKGRGENGTQMQRKK
jgi:hypothetical protein